MYLCRCVPLPLLAVRVADEEVEEADVPDEAFVVSPVTGLAVSPAGTEREEDICPIDLERTLRPFSCKLLFIESSSDGRECEMADDELDEGMLLLCVVEGFVFRCVKREASREPKLFFDLLDGALVDRVKVDV